MNRWQEEVQNSLLKSEDKAIKAVEKTYKDALKDINKKVSEFQTQIDLLDEALNQEGLDETARTQLLSQKRSKIYQQQYQQSLNGQVSGILDKMQADQYSTIENYLNKSYENGYLGAMYDLQHQGIPIITPIDQSAVVRAVLTDSKISKGLYTHLGLNVSKLKKSITQEISRGIASSLSYKDIARNLENVSKAPLARTNTIVRTEGHRIQQTAHMDAQYVAKSKGADIVKQWDATLDGATRPSHQMVDGEIRELDEKFSNGLMFPGDSSGGAAEVCNCRCCLLQRARWDLDDKELQVLKDRADYYGLDKTKNFEDYKQKYLQAAENIDIINNNQTADKVLDRPVDSSDSKYKELIEELQRTEQKNNLSYNPVKNNSVALTSDEIISALSGGDKTRGSCASVGLAYIGQKQGWDVLDFRDGESRVFFSWSSNLRKLSEMSGVKTIRADGASSMTVASRLLKQCEVGKEYYLSCGRHASIVRAIEEAKTDDITGEVLSTTTKLQYLELQSAVRSGWNDFNGNVKFTLKNRFGCNNTSGSSAYFDFMIDIDDSDFSTDEFKSLLGYINTSADEQRKGTSGSIK